MGTIDRSRMSPHLPVQRCLPGGCPYWDDETFQRLVDIDRRLVDTIMDRRLVDMDYYDHRATICHPLPHCITERIPLEVYEHVISFLWGRSVDLLCCALVCHAWNHYSLALLYERISICHHRQYTVLAHRTARSKISRIYLASTRILEVIGRGRYLPRAGNYYTQSFPLTLCGSMPNLQCLIMGYQSPTPLYRRRLVLDAFSRFTALKHLTLLEFEIYSFSEFCRIVCALRQLRELSLVMCSLRSRSHATNANTMVSIWEGFVPEDIPRLERLDLQNVSQSLGSLLASWVAITDVCSHATHLLLVQAEDRLTLEEREPWTMSIIDRLAPSLTTIYYINQVDTWVSSTYTCICGQGMTFSLTNHLCR